MYPEPELLIEISFEHYKKYMDRNNKVTMTLALRLLTSTNQVIIIISSEILAFSPLCMKINVFQCDANVNPICMTMELFSKSVG